MSFDLVTEDEEQAGRRLDDNDDDEFVKGIVLYLLKRKVLCVCLGNLHIRNINTHKSGTCNSSWSTYG